ncbi:hypothetical protein NDU88_001721 [Pleurodeles waltl]|uniref:Uncharacterized protein n=1 Tax=Pleurodeles waltl TaxID=8319 RepID=A0AAV7VXA6_PLEWA|nr:hypothetical protein NDU88_001721 [Pleurodeles waltl]
MQAQPCTVSPPYSIGATGPADPAKQVPDSRGPAGKPCCAHRSGGPRQADVRAILINVGPVACSLSLYGSRPTSRATPAAADMAHGATAPQEAPGGAAAPSKPTGEGTSSPSTAGSRARIQAGGSHGDKRGRCSNFYVDDATPFFVSILLIAFTGASTFSYRGYRTRGQVGILDWNAKKVISTRFIRIKIGGTYKDYGIVTRTFGSFNKDLNKSDLGLFGGELWIIVEDDGFTNVLHSFLQGVESQLDQKSGLAEPGIVLNLASG